MTSIYPVRGSENACPAEKSKKKKRKKERKATGKPGSNPPQSKDIKSFTVTTGRPLPPKPGKLDPINKTSQSKTPISQSSKTSASEIKTTLTDKENDERKRSPRWKIFLFVILLIFISVTCGIVFFPILITVAYICPKEEASDSSTKKGKPIYLIPLIILMWLGVVILMFPLTFVLVYFIHCDQMTFRYVVTR